MASNPRLFENGYYYHIFNRGVDKRTLFQGERDYIRFLRTIKICNDPATVRITSLSTIDSSTSNKTYVSIINFVLMPNHYHLTLRQTDDNGITQFLQRLGTSYSKYFNTKYKRTGRLFECTYKAKPVETEEQLIHLSRYIHLNPLLAGLVKNLNDYRWSSYNDYIGKETVDFCNHIPIMSLFSSPQSYERFVLDQIDYAKKLKEIKKLIDTFEAAP